MKQLYLAHNRFEDPGAAQFQEAISDNESLELLDLSWNHFGRVGAALLAQGLQVRSLFTHQKKCFTGLYLSKWKSFQFNLSKIIMLEYLADLYKSQVDKN